MTLQDRIETAKGHIGQALSRFSPERSAVAFTGGKDSTVVLHLYREVLRERGYGGRPIALSLDTGYKFAAVTACRDRIARDWDVDLRVVSPLPEEIESAGPAGPADKAACCLALKINPLRRAVRKLGLAALLTGIRADEHESRRERPVFENRVDPEYVSVNVLLDWTALDVWTFVADRALPYCELYDQGYASLGCQPCTRLPGAGLGERSGRAPDKEAILASLHSLGYF